MLICNDCLGVISFKLGEFIDIHSYLVTLLIMKHHQRLGVFGKELHVHEGSFRLKQHRDSIPCNSPKNKGRAHKDEVGAQRKNGGTTCITPFTTQR